MRKNIKSYEPEYQKIARRIRLLRMSKGLTQIELSRLTGIAQTGLSSIECGKTPVTLRRLIQFRDALGCKMRDFFEEEEEPVENDVTVEEVIEAIRIMRQIQLAEAREN